MSSQDSDPAVREAAQETFPEELRCELDLLRPAGFGQIQRTGEDIMGEPQQQQEHRSKKFESGRKCR